jgi:endonuclease YncB( thermonuclease family)
MLFHQLGEGLGAHRQLAFHVRTADGKECIFRLYFVDTPESESSLPERLVDQAAYFGTAPEKVVGIGKDAKAFTAKTLSVGPFTVWTRWRDALGRSKLPRFYAIIQIGNKDLGEMLVTAGLARIYGTRVPLPDGSSSRDYLAKLGTLESQAKAAGRGSWAK